MKHAVDIQAILAPIPGENPAGESLRYTPVYDDIKEARRADDMLDLGDWQHEVKTSDWDRVADIAIEALTSRTKDLQIAAWLLERIFDVLTALLISGRVGASIAAELGTMSVSEEIDALRVLGINPVRYLAMPRFLACATMLPILVIYADVLGIIGGGVVAASVFGSTAKNYIDQVTITLDFMEIFKGLVKAFVFGGIIGIVSCHQGMNTTGGAEGVGKATTETVVYSFIGIFVSNFFITRLWL